MEDLTFLEVSGLVLWTIIVLVTGFIIRLRRIKWLNRAVQIKWYHSLRWEIVYIIAVGILFLV